MESSMRAQLPPPASAAPVAERMPEVQDQLESLHNQVGRTEVVVESLLQKITSVLSVSEPLPAKDEKYAETALCPVADHIRGERIRLTKVNSALEAILERLEN